MGVGHVGGEDPVAQAIVVQVATGESVKPQRPPVGQTVDPTIEKRMLAGITPEIGVVWTADSFYFSVEVRGRLRRLTTVAKSLRFAVRRVSKCSLHAKTCQFSGAKGWTKYPFSPGLHVSNSWALYLYGRRTCWGRGPGSASHRGSGSNRRER